MQEECVGILFQNSCRAFSQNDLGKFAGFRKNNEILSLTEDDFPVIH